MSWYRIIVTEQMFDTGAREEIANAFRAAQISAGGAKDVALLTSGLKADLTIVYFFSPASISYCSEVLARFGGVPCAKPDTSEAKLYIGNASFTL